MSTKSGEESSLAFVIYSTFPNAENALSVGRDLVESGLAACINILPAMHSVYRWKGAIEEADEAVAIFKTGGNRVKALTKAIEETHPYDTPAIVVVPITGGSERYLEWILAETGEGPA